MIISELFEAPQRCPECGGISFSNLILAEKKDACYHKVKASAKVWPSAYASGRLVQCRKKGAANYGNKSEGVEEGQLNEFAPGNDGEDSGHWYTDSELADIIGDDWFEDFDVSNDGFNMDAHGEKAKKNLVGYANAWFDDKGYNVNVMGVEHNDVDHDLQWYIVGSFHNPRFANEGVAEAKDKFSTSQQGQDFRDQADYGGEDPDARDRYGNLKRSTSPGLGGTIDIGGVDVPVDALGAGLGSAAAIGSLGGTKGMFGKPQDSGTTSRDIATQRDTGQGISSLGQSGKVITSPTADRALTNLGGKNVETTPGPTVTVQKRGSEYEPLASDVPAYVRQGKPNPATIPKPGTKPKIIIRPGETMNQALQRTKDKQEFGNFLQGQGGQKFGNPTTAQATSGAGQVPTIKLPNGQTIPDPYQVSPSGQYGRFDKMARDDEAAVDAMVKRARQSALDREAREKKQSDSIQPVEPSWKNRNTDVDLEEERKKRKEPEVDYDAIDHDKSVARLRHLAGIGPMKTVYDPARRVYKNVPTAQQPKK